MSLSESELASLECRSAAERDRRDSFSAIFRYSSEPGLMSSLCLTSMVDFRPLVYFAISFLKTRTETMPRLMERDNDHLNIPADIVRLVFVNVY